VRERKKDTEKKYLFHEIIYQTSDTFTVTNDGSTKRLMRKTTIPVAVLLG